LPLFSMISGTAAFTTGFSFARRRDLLGVLPVCPARLARVHTCHARLASQTSPAGQVRHGMIISIGAARTTRMRGDDTAGP